MLEVSKMDTKSFKTNNQASYAPGAPGSPAKWTSSAKTGVGTALSNMSHVWFTLSHGIFNEIYYPRIDQACIRDMGFIVTDGVELFSEEKRRVDSKVEWMAEGVPAFKLTNTSRDGRYIIEKEVVTDPYRDTVLQKVKFTTRDGNLAAYQLYILLAPHLGNQGGGNTAWIGEFEGTQVLFAQRGDIALALVCSALWTKKSAGYVGTSDGWQDLNANKNMTWEYQRAENGNVALTAGIDLVKSKGEFILALGFGCDPDAAAKNAIASLNDGFEKAKRDYTAGWQEWMKSNFSLKKNHSSADSLAPQSLAVIRAHESKKTPGAFIASLSIPWGASHGDNDQGGYHLIWPRDMVEAAGGLLAAGAHEDVRRVLTYLQTTQQPDGHWPQNMWLDGSPYWNGIQMDETALPILLVDLAYREKALKDLDMVLFWPMVRQAAAYLVCNGPVSPQDRWEEDPGYSPFTVAAEIAALLVAAEMADLNHESTTGTYLRESADVWNDSIDRWLYVTNSDWCRQYNVKGYYVRIAPVDADEGGARFETNIHIKNVQASEDTRTASHLVSPDALALARFGLRAATDPRMKDTAKIIDKLLGVNTQHGFSWHRYNGDGYGEHLDGSPFDGTGIGRAWPLLTGERAHFALLAGIPRKAEALEAAMEAFANESGLISEQVWERADIPKYGLHNGHATGSAMPLVWAHAEYLKLQRSLLDDKVFDLPPQTVKRYIQEKTFSPRLVWRFNHKIRSMPAGKTLRIETMARGIIHWSDDNWTKVHDLKQDNFILGIHYADLPTQDLPIGGEIKFTFYWPEADRWEGTDYTVIASSE
ncbi:MAG: glucan 1,4-alpha-glucosidase [Mucilaginibacter sp.]